MTLDMNEWQKNSTRVRGVLITSDSRLLLLKRIKHNRRKYWVFPGGGVEESDADPESALRREIFEEVGGHIEIHKLLFISKEWWSNGLPQYQLFFLCSLLWWDGIQRGPEFSVPGSGQYIPEKIPLTLPALRKVNLVPSEFANFLARYLEYLDLLPDFRLMKAHPLIKQIWGTEA